MNVHAFAPNSGATKAQGWTPRAVAGLLLLLAIPLALFLALRLNSGIDPMLKNETFHFWIVSAAALLGLLTALAVLRASANREDIWVYFVGLGFLSISGVFLLHSLATQNVLFSESHPSFALSPPASLAAGGLFFGLSAVRYRRATEALLVRSKWALLVVWLAAYAAYVIAVFAFQPLSEAQPAQQNDSLGYGYGYGQSAGGAMTGLISVVTAVTVGLFALGLLRYWRLLRRRNSVVLFSVMAGLVLFLDAEVAMMYSGVWRLSWWLYHAAMLAGFSVIAYGILLEYRRHQTFTALFDGLTLRDAIARIERDYNEATRALVAAVEAKDAYTRGHSARVSDFSVRIADRLGLEDRDIDRVRHAGVLHDIGKIAVAEALLNKPGKLEELERDAVERHPDAGHTMVETVPSLRAMIPGIRHHHEHYDGSGYPDGLAGQKIALDARIIAVADVWDALTSDRAYRPALSRQVAVDIIASGVGSHFDPGCVEAFLATGIAPAPSKAADAV